MSLLRQLLEFNMFFYNLESFYSESVLICLLVIQLHTPYLSKNHTFRISRCYWYASSFTTVRTKWLVLRFFLPSEGVNLLNLNIFWVGVWVCVCLWVQTWGGPSGAAHGWPPGAASVGGGSGEGRGSYCAIDRRGLSRGGPAWATTA